MKESNPKLSRIPTFRLNLSLTKLTFDWPFELNDGVTRLVPTAARRRSVQRACGPLVLRPDGEPLHAVLLRRVSGQRQQFPVGRRVPTGLSSDFLFSTSTGSVFFIFQNFPLLKFPAISNLKEKFTSPPFCFKIANFPPFFKILVLSRHFFIHNFKFPAFSI